MSYLVVGEEQIYALMAGVSGLKSLVKFIDWVMEQGNPRAVSLDNREQLLLPLNKLI